MKRRFRCRKHSKPYADHKTLTVSLHVISEDYLKMNLTTEFRACVLLDESHFAFVYISERASKCINMEICDL